MEQPVLRGPLDDNPDGSVTLSIGPSSSVSGQILNESDLPLAGAEVKISYADGDRVLASGSADDNGNYTINGLPGGNYDVFTSAPGHAYGKTPVITAPGGAATLDSQLLLSKAGVTGISWPVADQFPMPPS